MIRREMRKLEPIELTSGVIFNTAKLTLGHFQNEFANTALETGQAMRGFASLSDTGEVETYTLSRQPRKKIGIVETHEYARTLANFGDYLNLPIAEEVAFNDYFRVVLSRLGKETPDSVQRTLFKTKKIDRWLGQQCPGTRSCRDNR